MQHGINICARRAQSHPLNKHLIRVSRLQDKKRAVRNGLKVPQTTYSQVTLGQLFLRSFQKTFIWPNPGKWSEQHTKSVLLDNTHRPDLYSVNINYSKCWGWCSLLGINRRKIKCISLKLDHRKDSNQHYHYPSL